jgi:predicted transcriptional regulator
MTGRHRQKLKELTDLQLAVLDVVWQRGEATANDIHDAIDWRPRLARGTIGTLLHRLERQRILTHRLQGREYLYRVTVSRDEVLAARVEGLVGGLFGGDLPAMVSFAVASSDVTPGDLSRIRALLDRHTSRPKS